MADMDQGIKRLVQSHPRDVLGLALPEAEYLASLPVDVATEPQLVLDTLQRVRYHGEECLVDIEAEAYPKPDIGRRCFVYGSRASVLHELPVISVVLWLERGGVPPPSPYQMQVAELRLGTWPFFGIEVYNLPAERVLAGDLAPFPALLALVPFMQGGSGVATLERAIRSIQERSAAADETGELATLLAVFAARALGETSALELVRRVLMSTEILEQSPLYRHWLAEGEARGVREAALAVVRGRWTELPAEVEAAIESASIDKLLDVLAHVTTDTQEQMRARFGL
jgi:hypothetical protein